MVYKPLLIEFGISLKPGSPLSIPGPYQAPWVLARPHLSKHPSDLKQNCTQEKTPFSSTVFHALSHDVILFVASVSSKNHLLAG